MTATDPQILNWVVQGGSFALVVAIAWYMGFVLIPKTISAFERQATTFDQMLQRTENRHRDELEKRDERDDRIASAVERIAERLTRLETRSDEREDREERYGTSSQTPVKHPKSGPVPKYPRGDQ